MCRPPRKAECYPRRTQIYPQGNHILSNRTLAFSSASLAHCDQTPTSLDAPPRGGRSLLLRAPANRRTPDTYYVGLKVAPWFRYPGRPLGPDCRNSRSLGRRAVATGQQHHSRVVQGPPTFSPMKPRFRSSVAAMRISRRRVDPGKSLVELLPVGSYSVSTRRLWQLSSKPW
jgi:hypothetical protein